MKSLLNSILAALFLTLTVASVSAADTRCYEMRVYYSPAGRLDDLHSRFRNHTTKLFEKHGMENIGYWVPKDNPDNKLIYILAYPSREARDKSWKAFMSDPEWQAVARKTEANGRIVSKVESFFMKATDYSPAIKSAVSSTPRVFEMRTYISSQGNLPALHSRFRDHTVRLFEKHGMTNFGYWELMPDQKGADSTLIYILGHASREAAAASFKSFGADPAWVAARKASEEKAGGSLTAKGGVTSVFMDATDYSTTR